MQIADKAPVQSNFTGRTVDFQLDLSNAGHITQILRKQIYSRHDLAVVREYITNALDEHAKYGIDTPVAVHLPSRHNNFIFSIRDFAKGLPTEDIEDLYVKYGASTKRDSNTQTGCLGIGCKAAFAYTDTFNIKSYHSSGVHKYVATLTNATGQLHHISSESDYGEPTGMLISVPIPEAKAVEFMDTAIQYLNYIPKDLVHIIIDRGNGPEDWNQDESDHAWLIREDSIYLKSNDDSTYPWYFCEDSPMAKGTGCVVTMGNVPYPIDTNNISGASDWSYIGNKRLVIEAPLGSLSIAANREEIQYDDRSALTLGEIDKDISRTIQQRIQETIEEADTWQEALKTYTESQKNINPEYRNNYHSNRQLWGNIKQYTWKGQELVLSRKANDIRYSEHVKKSKWSSANIVPYTWSHDHQGVHYGKSTDKLQLVQTDGEINTVYLWDPTEISEHKMKQLIGYNHRLQEGDDDMATWCVIFPRDEAYHKFNQYPDYNDLLDELSFMGDDLKELKDLPEPPKKAASQNFINNVGQQVTVRSDAKYICSIVHGAGRQTDRLKAVKLDDANDLHPTFTKGDKKIHLFFPFLRHKLLYPDSKHRYPYQTEDIGRWTHNNCPLTLLLKTMDPELKEYEHEGEEVVNYYGVPARRKLPENGIWFHDYATKLFDKFSNSKLYKDQKAWEAADPHRNSNNSDISRNELAGHCLFHQIKNEMYENSSVPLIKKLREFELTVAQDIYQDCQDTRTINTLFKNHPGFKNKNELSLKAWEKLYDEALRRFPLLPSFNKNRYLRKWHDRHATELDWTWEAQQKYIKAPIDMETDKSDCR